MATGAYAIIGKLALVDIFHRASRHGLGQGVTGHIGRCRKLTLGIFVQPYGAKTLGVQDTAVIHTDCVDDVGARSFQHGSQYRAHSRRRVLAIVLHDVVQDFRPVGIGLRVGIVRRIAGEGKISEGDSHRVIAGNDIALDHYVIAGHDQHTGSGGNVRNK